MGEPVAGRGWCRGKTTVLSPDLEEGRKSERPRQREGQGTAGQAAGGATAGGGFRRGLSSTAGCTRFAGRPRKLSATL
jgi:hypothetical protein